jgi:hypothetical protein
MFLRISRIERDTLILLNALLLDRAGYGGRAYHGRAHRRGPQTNRFRHIQISIFALVIKLLPANSNERVQISLMQYTTIEHSRGYSFDS